MAIFPGGGESSGRFRSAAAHYLAGRPEYAGLLIRRVASLVGLRRDHAVLDLGCGPGVLARAFAPLAGEVAAMDPEPEMLRVAAEFCAGIGNIRLVAGGSGDLAPSLGRFRLVAMGRSFHWMDRAATLRRLDALVEPGGAVALFHTGHAAVPVNAWADQFRELRRRHGGDAGDRVGPNGASGVGWVRHEAFLLASAFRCVEAHSVFAQGEVDAGRLVDRAFSMSGTTPARLGDRAADLERDIAVLVRDMAPDGRLTEVIESSALVARRPGEAVE
ncbi:MAG TPA: class I SAM-dependent methyltransferase [Acetobacteraceae bacterium]|nr:class I SAM-dependent methyltransferase [Acetobacteraceae bacterium]